MITTCCSTTCETLDIQSKVMYFNLHDFNLSKAPGTMIFLLNTFLNTYIPLQYVIHLSFLLQPVFCPVLCSLSIFLSLSPHLSNWLRHFLAGGLVLPEVSSCGKGAFLSHHCSSAYKWGISGLLRFCLEYQSLYLTL